MLLVVKGKVDDWRKARDNAVMIVKGVTGNEVNIFTDAPLPFDDEIIEMDKKDEQHAYDEYYHRWASEQMQSIKWPGKEQKN